MTKQMNYDEALIFNSCITPVKQHKISISVVSMQNANAFNCYLIKVYCSSAAWLRFDSSNPTAAADDGISVYHPANFIVVYKVTPGNRIAVIRDSANGECHVSEGV